LNLKGEYQNMKYSNPESVHKRGVFLFALLILLFIPLFSTGVIHAATPTPTIPANAVTFTLVLVLESDVAANTAIVDISPPSLEGISRIVTGYGGTLYRKWTLSYLPNTNVSFKPSYIERTYFSGWQINGKSPGMGPFSVVIQGGEIITGFFWALKPTPWATPTPRRRVTPTVRPTPSRRGPTVTPTPTPTPTPTKAPTPTPTRGGGYAVAYVIQSDWGNGATVNVTVTNNTSSVVSYWNLTWTFPGNQTITNLWSGVCNQNGTAVSVSNDASNPIIAANGGAVYFGFNLSYSGTNAKPTFFMLNGIACQTQ
jgi:cellulase/cellobiase CelA1